MGLKKFLRKHGMVLNDFALEVNDFVNGFYKRRLLNSFKVRYHIYGEGVTRLSNDHDISLYYQWPSTGISFWAEVPCFSFHAMRMFKENNVLELGCANGWYLREFYFKYANLKYLGVDLSESTICEANRKLKKKEHSIGRKIDASFVVGNMLTDLSLYDIKATNVFWYASINMFSSQERKKILSCIAKCLNERNGILSGNADLKNPEEQQWELYVGLYTDESELRAELGLFFKNVYIAPNKKSSLLFFMASNGDLPFYNEKIG